MVSASNCLSIVPKTSPTNGSNFKLGGKDPEVRRLDDGRAVVNFSLATSESYKNKSGEGLPFLTSTALKIFPSKKDMSSVIPSVL